MIVTFFRSSKKDCTSKVLPLLWVKSRGWG
jgi:hypothetical protein